MATASPPYTLGSCTPIQQKSSSLGNPTCSTMKLRSGNSDAASSRSEERRVGKECRSRCDWSSDVCSSDLDVGLLHPDPAEILEPRQPDVLYDEIEIRKL